jgi:type IV pilus assembly protein PilV
MNIAPQDLHLTPARKSLRNLSVASNNKGVSLIEILIAVLILSFGLLGMAALQTRALQGNQSSLQRSQAVMLNASIIDAMRIDRDTASIGSYNITRVCGPEGIGTGGTLVKNNQIAWLTAARDNMGGSAASPVCGSINCNASFVCTVSLEWDDSKAGGLSAQTAVLTGRL